MPKKRFYVTTPIYYVNGEPHIGTIYTDLAADVIARYKRLNKEKVYLLTGTDEHGEKAEQSAMKNKENVKEYVDKMSKRFKEAFNKINISYDRFIRTTDEDHIKTVNAFYKKVKAKGDIYKGKYKGLYCVSCETFWTEKELKNNRCPDCRKEVKPLAEETYFFKQSKYQDRIINHIKKNPGFIEPESRRNEIMEFLKKPLRDLSITRTSFNWGIPLPDDKKHVIYVWFDALVNYLTATGYPKKNYTNTWPADIHFIGKEITRFHCITWIAMLLSAGIKLPKKIFAHGWWTVNGEKMSKSVGNVIYPDELCKKYGTTIDAIRYVLFRQMPLGSDGDFSDKVFIERVNNELASELGNLISRSTAMLEKYTESRVPNGAISKKLLSDYNKTLKAYKNCMEGLDYFNALNNTFNFIHLVNKYIADTKPWELAKNKNKELNNVLYNLTQAINAISALINPFMPTISKLIDEQLGKKCDYNKLFNNIKKGTITKKGEILFKKIESEIKKEEGGKITYDDFKKTKLITAKILKAEPHGNRLLKLKVKADRERTILAGIKDYYKPEELIGKTVIIVANLEPKKLAGEISDGMILAAEKNGKVVILTTDKEVGENAEIR